MTIYIGLAFIVSFTLDSVKKKEIYKYIQLHESRYHEILKFSRNLL